MLDRCRGDLQALNCFLQVGARGFELVLDLSNSRRVARGFTTSSDSDSGATGWQRRRQICTRTPLRYAFVRPRPGLAGLCELSLENNRIGDAGVRALLESPHLGEEAERINLRGNPSTLQLRPPFIR